MRPDEPNPARPAPAGHVLICSYVPLLAGSPRRILGAEDPEILTTLEATERCPSGQADAFLWVIDGDGLQPVFAIERADAIAEHLLAWSEGRPGEWFALCFAERGGRFFAALVPNLTRSIVRFEATRGTGDAPPVRGYDLLFRPLFFVSQPRPTFGQVRHLVTSPIRVGLLASGAFAASHPPSLALDRVRPVGPVGVCWDERPFGHDVRQLFDHFFERATGPDPQ
ncbi:hypothetical protein R5W24_005123 [Gemmata sp. JC717]|uniref:hypothetical protein n=1 Tax=Gemmata algarum TaxID=2975278 RepID=UPI0021BAF623|nr:hypothetical protein [Gemmata algarum]MDY3555976.1 hypothetical protein [Gemmata algarum]